MVNEKYKGQLSQGVVSNDNFLQFRKKIKKCIKFCVILNKVVYLGQKLLNKVMDFIILWWIYYCLF